MLDRYRAAFALTSLLLAGAAPRHHHHANHRRANAAQASLPPADMALYSRSALRRARRILQLKLLELHEEQLERVRSAILRGVPIDRLLQVLPSPHP